MEGSDTRQRFYERLQNGLIERPGQAEWPLEHFASALRLPQPKKARILKGVPAAIFNNKREVDAAAEVRNLFNGSSVADLPRLLDDRVRHCRGAILDGIAGNGDLNPDLKMLYVYSGAGTFVRGLWADIGERSGRSPSTFVHEVEGNHSYNLELYSERGETMTYIEELSGCPDAEFDVSIAVGMFSRVRNRAGVLAQMRRVSRRILVIDSVCHRLCTPLQIMLGDWLYKAVSGDNSPLVDWFPTVEAAEFFFVNRGWAVAKDSENQPMSLRLGTMNGPIPKDYQLMVFEPAK